MIIGKGLYYVFKQTSFESSSFLSQSTFTFFLLHVLVTSSSSATWSLHPSLLSSAHRGGQQDPRVKAVVCQSPLNHLGQCRKGSTVSFTVAFQILRTGLFEVPKKTVCLGLGMSLLACTELQVFLY